MSLNAKNTLNNTINLNNLSVMLTFTISQKLRNDEYQSKENLNV